MKTLFLFPIFALLPMMMFPNILPINYHNSHTISGIICQTPHEKNVDLSDCIIYKSGTISTPTGEVKVECVAIHTDCEMAELYADECVKDAIRKLRKLLLGEDDDE